MLRKIAIIGRPNVGKSTLFNRLSKTKKAIVHDMPGVTRDRREEICQIDNQKYVIIDTPGLEEEEDEKTIENRMMLQTKEAAHQANICLMVIDGRAGVTPIDRFFANWLRKLNKKVITVVNKCEGSKGSSGIADAFSLGFSDIISISAEHNENIQELKEIIVDLSRDDELPPIDEEAEKDNILKLAIIGRPNTGKSTLLNHLYGSQRVLTGPEAGLTRDSIAVDLNINGRDIRLIDTAGMRKKANVKKTVEKMSVSDSLYAIRFCHVAILMLDATHPLEKQDLTIADLVQKEGRNIIIALNKWDLIEDKEAMLNQINASLNRILQQVKNVPLVTISALNGDNIDNLMDACFDIYKLWNKRVSTSALNNWLKITQERHIPPLGHNNRRIKLKYITQGNIRPPTFTLFVNNTKDLPASYKKYLINSMRDDLGLPGVPIRLLVRTSNNPYVKE